MRKIFMCILCLLLAGCQKDVLYQADSGKTLTYSVGKNFSLQLRENPSTGYTWHLKTIPESQQVISLVSDRYESSDTKAVGSSGKHLFFWQAVNAGEVEIQGFHARPWVQSKEEPSVIYKIIVR